MRCALASIANAMRRGLLLLAVIVGLIVVGGFETNALLLLLKLQIFRLRFTSCGSLTVLLLSKSRSVEGSEDSLKRCVGSGSSTSSARA